MKLCVCMEMCMHVCVQVSVSMHACTYVHMCLALEVKSQSALALMAFPRGSSS